MSFRRLVVLESDYVVCVRCNLRLGGSYVLRIETEPPEEKNGEESDEDVGSASRWRSFCEEHLHGDGWIRV